MKSIEEPLLKLSPSITSPPSFLYNSFSQIENYNEQRRMLTLKLSPEFSPGVALFLPSGYVGIYRRIRTMIDVQRYGELVLPQI